MQPNQNAQAAMQILRGMGYSPIHAAGIVGNLMQESSVNPMTRPGDHGTAHGIAQWRGDRWAGAQQYAQQSGGDLSSLSTQLGYLDQELRTRYPHAYRALINSRTPEEAAGAFGLHYERPAGAQTGTAQNIDGYANRANVARALVGMSPMAMDMANAIGGRRNSEGPEWGGMAGDPRARQGANYASDGFAPPIMDASGGGRRSYDDSIPDPGDTVIAGGDGGGGGGVSTTPGGDETNLSDLHSGAAGVDPNAFAQDTSGISDIESRLQQKKQLAAMGQGEDVGEISPLGQVFDAKSFANIGAAGRRSA
jgi:hypothetical protein